MTLDELEQLEKSAYIDGPMVDITKTGAIFNTSKGNAFDRIGEVSLNILPEVIALVRAVDDSEKLRDWSIVVNSIEALKNKLGAQ